MKRLLLLPLFVGLFVGLRAETTRYVHFDGICGGNSPCYTTIQQAIDNAVDGDKILVSPGTYTESVVVNKANITLQSTNGREETIIDAGGQDFRGIEVMGNLGIVTIDGFKVINWGPAGIVQRFANYIGTTVHVLNNHVIGQGHPVHGNCIQVTGDNSTVIGNIVAAATYTGTNEFNASGILVYLANNAVVQNNQILNCEIGIGVAGGGAWGYPAVTNVTITGNSISNGEAGIQVSFDASNTNITQNSVSNCDYGLQELFMWNYGPSNTNATYNNFANNTVGATITKDEQTPVPLDHSLHASNNFWGTSNIDDISAMMEGSITFTPYLVLDEDGDDMSWDSSNKYKSVDIQTGICSKKFGTYTILFTNNFLTVENTNLESNTKISIYTISGKKIADIKGNAINISGLVPAMYIVEINIDGYTYTEKLFIK
jgi:hypothetical protein